jgi:hypothetical protein
MVVVYEGVEGVQDNLSPCHASPSLTSWPVRRYCSAADLPLQYSSNLTVSQTSHHSTFLRKILTTHFTVHAPSDAPLVVPGSLVQWEVFTTEPITPRKRV